MQTKYDMMEQIADYNSGINIAEFLRINCLKIFKS